MISAERITELAGALGTVEGLVRVNAEIESLSRHLLESKKALTRDELVRMSGALDSLSVAILSIDGIARELLGQSAQAVDCVG